MATATITTTPFNSERWQSSHSKITLYQDEGGLRAEVELKGRVIQLTGPQIICGLMGNCSHQTMIEKITILGQGAISVVPYPHKNPTEVWIFEATPITGPLIIKAKKQLSARHYQEALKTLKVVLTKTNTEEVQSAILLIQKEIFLYNAQVGGDLYLFSTQQREELDKMIEYYRGCAPKELFSHLSRYLSNGEDRLLHSLFLAILSEVNDDFVFAVQYYLHLANIILNPMTL